MHGRVEAGSGRARVEALSAALARLAREYGRRPTGVTTWWLRPDCAVAALEGYLTPAEQALVETGQSGLLQQLRLAFVDAMAAEFRSTAERALGRAVSTHRSELLCESNVCLEIFTLSDAPPAMGMAGMESAAPLTHRDRT